MLGTTNIKFTFWPLQRHSNPVRTAAGVWPDCRLETNSLCWHQIVGGHSSRIGFSVDAHINSKVFDYCLLMGRLSWLVLCRFWFRYSRSLRQSVSGKCISWRWKFLSSNNLVPRFWKCSSMRRNNALPQGRTF